MHRLRLLFWVLLLSGATALQAQAISGTVVDEEGIPLIGATILVEGTTTGTVTDIDGKFGVQAPANAEGLTISYTGFATKTVPLVGGQSVYNITLETDAIGLADVVVIGYSPVQRKNLVG